jgi:hypothetical protein
MFRSPTRYQTLYRLPGVSPTAEGMFDALTARSGELLTSMGADVQPIDIGGIPALWLSGQFEHAVASWCEDAGATTGLAVSHPSLQAAGLLMLAVDDVVCFCRSDIGGPGHSRRGHQHLLDIRRLAYPAVERLEVTLVEDVPGPGCRT